MEKRSKVLVTFSILVVLVAGLYLSTDWFSKVTGYFIGEEESTKLAFCLSQNGAEFYASTYCADCEKQTELFGRAFTEIKQIDCGNNKELCPNIRELPAWYINKEIHYGFKTFDELKEISGCKIK